VQMADVKVRVNLDSSRYDQKTFWGRFRHFIDVTDVRLMIITQQQINQAQKRITDFKQRGSPLVNPTEAKELWEAKKVVDATIHPQTGELIPLPVRLSSFVPINVVITAGMLGVSQTIAKVVFWQWVNQSYNIALNHAQRNTSNEMTTDTIVKTYAAAVAISCGVAVGLGQVVQRASVFSPAIRTNIQRFVPYTAVATAGIANVFMMRWNETQEGIMVQDANGNDVAKSQKAGVLALSQVAFSRCMTALPVLTFPPVLMPILAQTSLMTRFPLLKVPTYLGLIAGILWTALPAAVAIFPQQAEISSLKLEPTFHNLRDKDGKPITTLFYNRGL